MTDRKMIKLDEELSAKYRDIFKTGKELDLPENVEFYVVQGLVLACHPGNTSECIGLVDLRPEDHATVSFNTAAARAPIQAQLVLDVAFSSVTESNRAVLHRLAHAVSSLMNSPLPLLDSDIQIHGHMINASFSNEEGVQEEVEVPVYSVARPLEADDVGLADDGRPALLYSQLGDGHMLLMSGSDDRSEHFLWVGETPDSPACSDVLRLRWNSATHSLDLHSMNRNVAVKTERLSVS